MELARYFHPPYSNLALDHYAAFCRQAGWPLEHKLDLYIQANIAFGDPPSRDSFDYIYDQLSRHWQVFRGSKERWSADEIFDCLTQPTARKLVVLTLAKDWDDEVCDDVYSHFNEMRTIKSTSDYPWMPASKFMHFFNPCAFPIYDTAVVYDRVFRAFRRDYDAFVAKLQRERGIVYNKQDGSFNLIYSLWASSLLRQSDASLMAAFASWFRTNLPSLRQSETPPDINEYYATAFEFIAIGAAIAEGC